MTITVVDVCRALNCEPGDNLMWRTGEYARKLWQSRGNAMTYDLRPKKKGGGSHQFAVYPESFRSEIEKIIKLLTAADDQQGVLFEK
jgi:hypothetical protein